jgi:hypothetical protein
MKKNLVPVSIQKSRRALLATLLRTAQDLGQSLELEKQNKELLKRVNYMRKQVGRERLHPPPSQETRSLTLAHSNALLKQRRFLNQEIRKLLVRERGLRRALRRESSVLLETLAR